MGDGERPGAATALRNALVVTCALADAGVTAGAAEVERAALRGDRTASAGAAAWLAGRFAATCGPPAVPAGAGPAGVMDAVLRGGPAELARRSPTRWPTRAPPATGCSPPWRCGSRRPRSKPPGCGP